MESDEFDGEFYLDNLSDCPDCYSGGESGEESDDCDIKIRKRSSALSLNYSDSDEDELNNVQDDADNAEVEDGETWSKKDEAITLEPYKGKPGIENKPSSSDTIVECADLFMGNDFFEHLVNETNRYHSQVREKYPNRLREEEWTDITFPEMKRFLGLILLMGQIKKGGVDDYWSDDRFLRTPYFSQVMSKDRFMQIMEYWHFCNNETIPENSQRLVKLQPMFDYLQKKFTRSYVPRRHMTLEECVIPWRGKLSIRMRQPLKINKKGILVRMLCEAITGYICNIQLFDTDESKLQDTIVSMIEPYKNMWHHIYQDNYYNNAELAQILLENKIRMCGIVRRKEELPPSLQSVRLTKGKYDFRRNHQILVEVWNNGRRNVSMISTIHTAELMDSKRKQKGSSNLIKKPKSMVSYDKYTKGIDRAEHHLAYYSIFRKTKKWTKRVAIFFINCALFNSFKVFTAVNEKKYLTYRQFLHRVAVSWTQYDVSTEENSSEEIENEGSGEAVGSGSPSRRPERLKHSTKHKLGKIATKGRNAHPLRQCKVCAAHKKKSRTGSFCTSCLVPLHKGDCFERYHSLQEY